MIWTRRNLLTGAGAAMIAAGLPHPAASAVRVIAGRAFGTYWRLALPAGADVPALRALVDAVIVAVDDALSPYSDTSELSRFNAATATDWISLSPHCAAVAAEGLRIAALTGGAFDPTVGGIVRRYGFGPITATGPATYADLAFANGAMRKTRPGVTFDPCGVGKGYALDLIANGLDRRGIGPFMIEFGGEVLARGDHPDGRPWQIGVERPGAIPLTFQRIIRLNDEALATSGDAVNGYAVGARRYGHIIDPRTARPVDHDLASVSVIAPRAMTADALATALFVLGPEDGLAFALRQDLAALFVIRDGGDLVEASTPRLASHVLV